MPSTGIAIGALGSPYGLVEDSATLHMMQPNRQATHKHLDKEGCLWGWSSIVSVFTKGRAHHGECPCSHVLPREHLRPCLP